MPEPSVNRRVTPPKPTEELYSLSKKEIASFIEEERRHDELSRLNEIRRQKRVWVVTMIFCGLLNLGLLVLALIGWLYV